MMTLKRFGLWLMLSLVAATAAGCDNTIRGVGQDVQDTGDAIEDAVD